MKATKDELRRQLRWYESAWVKVAKHDHELWLRIHEEMAAEAERLIHL